MSSLDAATIRALVNGGLQSWLVISPGLIPLLDPDLGKRTAVYRRARRARSRAAKIAAGACPHCARHPRYMERIDARPDRDFTRQHYFTMLRAGIDWEFAVDSSEPAPARTRWEACRAFSRVKSDG